MLHLNHYLREYDEENTKVNKIRDVINLYNGELDIDCCDDEIDMMVAFCYSQAYKENSEYDKFIDILADNVTVKQLRNDIMICKFSEFFKPYNEQLKEFFNMDNSEFEEDEAYYEAVVNLEPLISGNASESTYKELNEILEGKPKITEGADRKIVNPDDKDYAGGKLYMVGLYPGAGAELVPFYIYAKDEQTALEIAVADAEKNAPGVLYTDSEIMEEVLSYIDKDPSSVEKDNGYIMSWFDYATEKLNYIYVDATPEGASQPYFVDGSYAVVEEKGLKESALSESTKDKISEIINNLNDLASTITYSVVDDALSINAKIDDLNYKEDLNIDTINTKDLYSGIYSIIEDLQYELDDAEYEEMSESAKSKSKPEMFYALFNDGGNPYSYIYSADRGNDSCHWYWTVSEHETKEAFRKRVKRQALHKAQSNFVDYNSDVTVKIFTDAEKFKQECNKVGINPNLDDLDESAKPKKLNEMDRLFKDIAGKYGIKSYFDMVYDQEPKSEYDKLIQQYMSEHDRIREKMIAIENEWKSKKDDREHYKEEYAKYKAGEEECREELSKLSELLDKAEKIPEEERGENWKDYKEIQKDDDDYFAQTMGYKDSEEAEKKGWGFSKLHESVSDLVDEEVLKQLRSSKVYSGEGLAQSYIRALRQKEVLQQTGKLTDEVAKAIDNEIQSLIDKSKEEPKPVEKPKVTHKHEEPEEYDSEDLPMDASPEEIDDYYSDLYYNKTQEETDPQKKFEYACYTAAAQWMSSVTEETSRDFIEGAILPVAKNAYYNSDYTDEDYMNEIIFNLQNERGIRFNFNNE